MSNRIELEAALWSILDALRAYREDLLLIGGWVPYLHITYGRAAEEGARTSLTAEADVVVPGRLPPGQRPPVAEILEAAGYHRLPAAAAVWERAPEHGERIEFFQAHRGPASRISRIRPVEDQPGLEALSLDHLWILGAFTDFVLVPAPQHGERPAPARIPLLGAFALNKANTFSLRGGADGAVKSAKDVLYLRDIMAAGERAMAARSSAEERRCYRPPAPHRCSQLCSQLGVCRLPTRKDGGRIRMKRQCLAETKVACTSGY